MAALEAVAKMHRNQVEKLFSEKLSSLVRGVEDPQLRRVVALLKAVDFAWPSLDSAEALRLKSYVASLPAGDFDELEFLLGFSALQASAVERVRSATRDDLRVNVWGTLPASIGDRMITLLLESKTFDQANQMAKQLLAAAIDLSGDQIRRIIGGIKHNSQITGANSLPALLKKLRESEALSIAEFDKIVTEHGLDDFVPF